MLLPAPPADLLGDQLIGGIGVGNAQQRLGKAHQDDAFLRGQRIFVHEGIDAAVLVAAGAGRGDEARCELGYVADLSGRRLRTSAELGNKLRFVCQHCRGDLIARR